jgi:2-polyprenyl-6-methoxyphenol hydroxylase-like FAD-dependent oxidoreductase
LVGDVGYNKDFITAQGIQDAFRDAELCVAGVDEAFSGARPFGLAMRDYQSARDEHVLPMYEFTADLASLEPPSPETSDASSARDLVHRPDKRRGGAGGGRGLPCDA